MNTFVFSHPGTDNYNQEAVEKGKQYYFEDVVIATIF